MIYSCKVELPHWFFVVITGRDIIIDEFNNLCELLLRVFNRAVQFSQGGYGSLKCQFLQFKQKVILRETIDFHMGKEWFAIGESFVRKVLLLENPSRSFVCSHNGCDRGTPAQGGQWTNAA